jgi:hypothetical protein
MIQIGVCLVLELRDNEPQQEPKNVAFAVSRAPEHNRGILEEYPFPDSHQRNQKSENSSDQ